MNENVLRTSLSACVSWLAKQITCQLSYWVIFWKKTCSAIRIKLALFHILIAKNPQVLHVIPTKYPKNQKTWMTWFFFLQGYQIPLKQPDKDCVLVIFIDPKIMKLFVDVNQLSENLNLRSLTSNLYIVDSQYFFQRNVSFSLNMFYYMYLYIICHLSILI